MALGEWLRQVMVETSALKHRAESVARLMASRQLVALRLESPTHTTLVVERASLRQDFMFLAGSRPRVTELFRGNAVDLVLERSRLKEEAARAQVVAAPWKFLEETADTLRWYPFLDAQLAVGSDPQAQLAAVPPGAAGRGPELKLRISSEPGDFDRFYRQLYLPYARSQRRPEPIDEQPVLQSAFNQGGVLALATGPRGRLLAGALVITRQRGALIWHRTGFADPTSLTAAQLADRRAALEAAVIRHASRLGFALIDFGSSPSLLTDPQFVRRRRLGCTFAPTPSSPALMLTIGRKLRPRLLARAPLVTGEPGAFVVRAGCSGEPKERALRRWVRGLAVAGTSRLCLATDQPIGAAGRILCERVLAEELAGVEVEIEQA